MKSDGKNNRDVQLVDPCRCRVLCRCRSTWTYMLDRFFGEDWEARRAFVERRLL